MIQNIHHVSSIVSNVEEDLAFYASFLGLRLVKQTLNYDDPSMYHLYYGNYLSSENLWTTFPMPQAPQGRLGGGQVKRTYFQVPEGSLDFWASRFEDFQHPYQRQEDRILFQDLSGLNLALIEGPFEKERSWSFNGIEKEQAFQSIQALEILSQDAQATEAFFRDVLKLEGKYEKEQIRFDIGSKQAIYLDKKDYPRGQIAVGTVHHLALTVSNQECLKSFASKLDKQNYPHSGLRDRKYFHSLYVREPGGLLIELATEGPGMLIDEGLEELGTNLKYPPHHPNAKLPPVQVNPHIKKIKKEHSSCN